MHLKRWITGLIALPFLIFLVYKGGLLFTILISIAGLAGFRKLDKSSIDQSIIS